MDGMRPAILGFVVGLAAILEAGRLMRDKPLKPDRNFSPGKRPPLQPHSLPTNQFPAAATCFRARASASKRICFCASVSAGRQLLLAMPFT
jgi:hypothetical protein